MRQFVRASTRLLFRADEKLAWREGNAVSEWRVKGFRAAVYYLRRIRHFGDDLLDGFDRIMLAVA